MNRIILPFEFLKTKKPLTWGELLWGYEIQYIGWKTIVDFAILYIENGLESQEIIELAWVDKSNNFRVGEILRNLAIDIDEEKAKRKWLCLILAWMYEKRFEYENPFYELTLIYDDFDQPEYISHFAWYSEIDEENENENFSIQDSWKTFYNNWKNFIDGCDI